MTTIRSDVLVLGSSLGGLVAAAYLARAGLRVALFEESCLAQRTPLLREPFLLSGLGTDGPTARVLRELTLPLLEQREIAAREVAYQVLLPESRIDVRASRRALAHELALHRLVEASAAEAWIERMDALAQRVRDEQWNGPSTATRSLAQRLLVERAPRDVEPPPALPETPAALVPFVRAQIAALSALAPDVQTAARPTLVRAVRDGGFEMPHGGRSFLDLFRRRLLTLHGEIHEIDHFTLVSTRQEIGIELRRGRVLGRALVLAAPRELVRSVAEKGGTLPRWLAPSPPPQLTPARLFRAHRDALPTGLARRAIVWPGDSERAYTLALHRDPQIATVEWMVAAGPGARAISDENPLADLCPFLAEGITPADPGPAPAWDADAAELRFHAPQLPPWLDRSPPVVSVGPDVVPDSGFEGELLAARRAALDLASRLGAKPAIA